MPSEKGRERFLIKAQLMIDSIYIKLRSNIYIYIYIYIYRMLSEKGNIFMALTMFS